MTPKRQPVACRSRLLRVFVPFQSLILLLVCLPVMARAQTTVNIHAISVFPTSPYMGDEVTTTGIVIAVLTDGFYIENQSDWDGDTCTSEGIYVYVGTGNVPSTVVSGALVSVTGTVAPSNNSNYAGVQINVTSPIATYLSVTSTGNTLPSAVSSSVLTAATSGTCSDYGVDAFGQWLPFEGMLVNIPSSSYLLVTQGTGGTVTPSSQMATTTGQFWAVFSDTDSTADRPFRAMGISKLGAVPSTAPSTVARWNGNPQLLLVDTTTLGGTALNASATTIYSGASSMVGIVDYHLSAEGYTGLLLTADSVTALSQQGGATPTAASAPASGQITIATQNLESSSGVGLADGETARITKLAKAIVKYENSPDIIAVQGATSGALGELVTAINSLESSISYTLSTISTADSGGYVNAFLISNAVTFDGAPTASQVLAATTYTPVLPYTETTLFDRSPLLLTINIPRTGISDYTMTLVNASLQNRTDIDDATEGAAVRHRREQQAEQLATQVLEPMENAGDHVMVLGGFDSFEFSDGYVDALGILDGLEKTNTTGTATTDTAGDLVTLYDPAFNTATLENTTTSATNVSAAATNPATSRYTYVESGSAEQTDHILITTTEFADYLSIDYARIGADFPVIDTYDTSTVARASSHDGVIAYFTVPYPTTTMITSNTPNPSYYDEPVTLTATVTSAFTGDSPSGTVEFFDGTTELGTGVLGSGTTSSSGGSATATLTISSLSVGTHSDITAYYEGIDTGSVAFEASTSAAVSQEVDKDVASLALTSSVNPSYYGQPVTFTATATSSNGAGGSGATPSGTVTFTDTTTGATLGTGTLSSGSTTLIISTLSIGTHAISATYSGDSTDLSATSNTVSQVVNANITTLTLVSSLNPSYYGEGVTFTVTAVGGYGTPAGTVAFYDGTTALGAGTLTSGTGTYTSTAAYTTALLAVGTHSITVVYQGNGDNAGGTSNTVSQTVLPVYMPISTLACSPNPVEYGDTVTCTDSVAAPADAVTAGVGIPSGTVTFYDGSASLGTETLSAGTATWSSSSLAVGPHTITAVYALNYPYLASTSNSVTEIVVSTFSLTAKPSSATVYTGEAVDSTITVTPGSGFTLDVALVCTGLPANTTCTLTPSTVTGGSGASKLVIQTTAPGQQKTTASNHSAGRGWPLVAGLLLLVIPRRLRRRGLWLTGLLMAAALAAFTLSGCGGSGTLSGGTPAGSYTVSVVGTATDGDLVLTHTATVTVKVESLF